MVSLPTDEFVAKEERRALTRAPPLAVQRNAGLRGTSKLDPTALVEDDGRIHQVPDELAAMSDYNTVGSRLQRVQQSTTRLFFTEPPFLPRSTVTPRVATAPRRGCGRTTRFFAPPAHTRV